ncbi:MAG: hypothetical protein KFF73_08620 [Cyclobacteriaceae bacterium]|nr:hypothetical protein [Cyclobacteriaceae bacterium]
MEEENENLDPESLPIYRKGREIFDVVHQLTELIPEDNKELDMIKEILITDASQLMIKVAGAEGGGLYDLKMEAATLIRKAARDLMVQNHALRMFGFKEVRYYEIVRELLEEYRLLFIQWVSEFDQWEYVIDRWGLFNPPGVGPFDHDPDDDLPETDEE